MHIQAIAIGLNGLVRPVGLGVVAQAEQAMLKSAFSEQKSTRFKLEQKGLKGGTSAQRKALKPVTKMFAEAVDSLVQQGATVQSNELIVYSQHLQRGALQVETAGRMHIDGSALNYKRYLEQSLITLRGLWVSERSPILCDISGEADPLSRMLTGSVQPDDEARYRAAGLLRTPAESEFMLMDMMTPHVARPVLHDTQRLLIDCRATLHLCRR